MIQDLTTTPTVLAGLTIGTRYTVQKQSRHTLIYQDSATLPADTSEAYHVSDSWFVIRRKTGQEVYVWIADDALGSGRLVYGEAP